MVDRPDAVLFDCDGVLVDSEKLTNQLLREDLARHGLDLSLEHVTREFTGGTMYTVAERARVLGAKLPGDWVPGFYDRMFEVMASEVEPVRGASDLIDDLLSAGVKMAVASNGPAAKMEITLRRAGMWDRLSPHIYSAQDLEQPKPAPDVYLHAASQLGAIPEKCVVIEDSLSGAQAGQAAGMRCIGYAPHGQAQDLAAYCDAVFTDMGMMAEALSL